MVWAEETEENHRTKTCDLLTILRTVSLLVFMSGVSCTASYSHYLQVEQTLAHGDPEAADALIEQHKGDIRGQEQRPVRDGPWHVAASLRAVSGQHAVS